MTILHLLTDLEVPFLKYFVKVSDTVGALIIGPYYTSIKFVDRLQGFSCSLTDRYLNSLEEDEFGDVSFKVRKNDSNHVINLNSAHKARRGDGMS